MTLAEYCACDGLALAQFVRSGEVTPQELYELAVQAIARIDPRINAIVGPTPEAAAAAIERRPSTEPFAGVPFLLKDIGAHMAGVPQEMGARSCRGYRLDYDSELAARFRLAGLVTIGRSAVPEFGCGITTESAATGPTRNPWNLVHSAGGSSGGACAAVAAGIVPIAHANDGGGSIRVPAAHCAVFGLKPSRGRQPSGPDADELAFGLCVEHVVTRSVRDSAAMLDATWGADVGARLALPRPETTFLESLTHARRPLRIAYSAEPIRGALQTHPECMKAVESAVRLCRELGHDVREGRPEYSLSEICKPWLDLSCSGFSGGIRGVERVTRRRVELQDLEPATAAVLEYARRLTADDLVAALQATNGLSRRLGAFFERYDVLITPVGSVPPPLLGDYDSSVVPGSALEWVEHSMSAVPYVAAFNQTGQPAMSVPLYWSDGGLPIGTQFAARLGQEATLLALASELEAARPWAHRHPPLWPTGQL
ncbi:MAG: amidase [Steroidobacteraceae bacterium]